MSGLTTDTAEAWLERGLAERRGTMPDSLVEPRDRYDTAGEASRQLGPAR